MVVGNVGVAPPTRRCRNRFGASPCDMPRIPDLGGGCVQRAGRPLDAASHLFGVGRSGERGDHLSMRPTRTSSCSLSALVI
jgi:hypothetical protein